MTAKKAVVAIIVSALGALVTALGMGNDAQIQNLDWKHGLVALATVLASGGVVYFTQNGPYHTYIKAVVGFLSAGVASLVVALNDNHITQSEWLIALSAAIVAGSAVYQTTNVGLPGGSEPHV